jgi:hypothetical protein
MLDHMRNHALLFLVIDRRDQRALHPGLIPYPYPCDGAVDVSEMKEVRDYIAQQWLR